MAVWRICAGSVRLVKVNMAATNTSFQDMINAKMAEAARPGSASGKVILKKARRRERPKIMAASSYSTDMLDKMLEDTRIIMGNAIAVCAKAMP